MATERQKKAIQNVMENRGNVSKAMRDAGYEHKTAKNPKNLTQSKAWKELMDDITDMELQEALREGIYADKPVGNGEVFPDYPTRHKYIDTLMKLKDKYPAQKKAIDHTSLGERIQPVSGINYIKPDGNNTETNS